jgi:hypothetical protein
MMTDVQLPRELTEIGAPDEIFFIRGDFQAVRRRVSAWMTDSRVRAVRGWKTRTWDGLYDEFEAALQFPLYFGRNLDALDESLAEPEYTGVPDARVCVIAGANDLLADQSHELERLCGALIAARSRVSVSRDGLAESSPGALSFVLELTSEIGSTLNAWSRAGAKLIEVGAIGPD